MYYKIINDRTVFSDCKVLYIESEDRWCSNPTEEIIFAEGWAIFVHPTPQYIPEEEPDMNLIIEAVKKMLASSVESLTDEEALEVAALYPTWHSKLGETISVGERLWYDGKLYKVIQSHTVQSNWTPDISTSLFTEVSIEEFPAWVQPTGAQDSYMTGDKVTHNGLHWECTIDYNVYEPGVYGWNQLN